jgi:UDP-3-O-[3-hydroxymyristoyl] glucosamine N-acyltransferase
VVSADCVIGAGTTIWQFASVTGGTVLGRDCGVSPFAMLHGPVFGDRCRISAGVAMGPGFKIGNDVFIGPNVTFANDAWPLSDKAGYRPEEFNGAQWAVIVEDGASIGANAVVLPGVRIGRKAMVAARSVVTNDVPAGHCWRDGVCRKILGTPDRMRFAV